MGSHIIEEAFICGRAKAKVAPIMLLCCFSEDMCGRMPENLLACERGESTGVSNIDGTTHPQYAQSREARASTISRAVVPSPTALHRP